MAAETKQFSGPVPRKLHTLLSHTSHNVRFKQTFLHFNVLAKKNFLKCMTLHKTRNILVKPFSREKLLRSESASGSDEQIQTWPSIVKKVLSEFNNLSIL